MNANSCVTGNARRKVSSTSTSPQWPHTTHFREGCYDVRQDEKKELRVNGKQWKRLVGMKRSRGKLATGLGAQGFEHKIMEFDARRCTRASAWKVAK